jgi:hypothetical protein
LSLLTEEPKGFCTARQAPTHPHSEVVADELTLGKACLHRPALGQWGRDGIASWLHPIIVIEQTFIGPITTHIHALPRFIFTAILQKLPSSVSFYRYKN